MVGMTGGSPATRDVVVREVGPRDGLQGLAAWPSTAGKVAIVRALACTGISRIEAGSFVSPRAVPAMADTAEVFAACAAPAGPRLEALVLTAPGAERALAAGAQALVCVVAASETFSQRNARAGVDEALGRAAAVADVARAADVPAVADIATSFGCAYEGRVPAVAVTSVAERLVAAGFTELTLADTTGMAHPALVANRVHGVRAAVGAGIVLGLHFHNTRGLALVNVAAGLEAGVRLFDASVGGLGGCPFSPGATGNVCTEDLVHFLHLGGWSTGIDLDALLAAARVVQEHVDAPLPGQLLRSGPVPDLLGVEPAA